MLLRLAREKGHTWRALSVSLFAVSVALSGKWTSSVTASRVDGVSTYYGSCLPRV
jgi:hypothetical protein